MNKAQKTVQLGLLQSEQQCIEQLEKAYKQALKDINAQIKQYQGDELTQSQIYQKQYQEALKAQVSAILDKMQADHYGTVQGYLKGCYEDSYIGVMYDLQQAGIPVTVPIQQDQVVKAVTTDSKLSKPLYESMGKYLKPLKKRVAAELTRGFASALHFNDIARNIANVTGIGLSNAKRIARTEGHRIQNAAALDAQKEAKEMGADVVKQWDSTMDGKTRKSHRKLDGQIREIDEPFEVGGHKAMAPGQFGRPEEDINCRCTILQRARWALDDDELEALKEKEKFWGLDNAKTFDDYKKNYKKQSAKLDTPEKIQAALEKAQAAASAKKDKAFNALLDGVGADEYEKLLNDYKNADDEANALKRQLAAVNAKSSKKALREAAEKAAPKVEHKAESYRRFSTGREADDYYRPLTGKAWKTLTKNERLAMYRYTCESGLGNYRQTNSLLRGISGRYNPDSRSGIDKKITDMTRAISKCELSESVHVRRGVPARGVAKFLNVDVNDLKDKDLQQSLIGQRFVEKAFCSTGCTEGAGFGGITYEIDVPAGMNAMYCEPFSEFGGGTKSPDWDGESGQSYIGGEQELLLQRGTVFEIDRFETDSSGNITKIHMHAVEQDLSIY